MDHVLAELDDGVVAAQAAYAAERGVLLSLVEPLVGRSSDAFESLVSLADEFGAEEAVERFAAGKGVDGHSQVGAQLERLLEARDELDLVTARREGHVRAGTPHRPQVIQIDGQAFEIDVAAGELRAVDDCHERYRLPDMTVTSNRTAAANLTQQIGEGVEKAQPTPQRGMDRKR